MKTQIRGGCYSLKNLNGCTGPFAKPSAKLSGAKGTFRKHVSINKCFSGPSVGKLFRETRKVDSARESVCTIASNSGKNKSTSPLPRASARKKGAANLTRLQCVATFFVDKSTCRHVCLSGENKFHSNANEQVARKNERP